MLLPYMIAVKVLLKLKDATLSSMYKMLNKMCVNLFHLQNLKISNFITFPFCEN